VTFSDGLRLDTYRLGPWLPNRRFYPSLFEIRFDRLSQVTAKRWTAGGLQSPANQQGVPI